MHSAFIAYAFHERRINVKKLSQGVRVPAAKAEGSGVQQRLKRASSFPACCPAPKGQCEGQADKCTPAVLLGKVL